MLVQTCLIFTEVTYFNPVHKYEVHITLCWFY